MCLRVGTEPQGRDAAAPTVAVCPPPAVRPTVSPSLREDMKVANQKRGIILNGLPSQVPDVDPEETQEWLDSLDSLVEAGGRSRARYIMLSLIQRAREQSLGVPSLTATDYINSIGPEDEPWFPGDEELERRFRRWIRWNAAVMVHRAQRPGIEVGGHISTYASAATLYEVGQNHFFRGKDHPGGEITSSTRAMPRRACTRAPISKDA